jgi:excisionase family DNA binding protein
MDRFKEFQAEQRPSELERARMRRVLGGLPQAKAQAGSETYADAVFSELRAMRSEVSSLRSLLTERMHGTGTPLDDEILNRGQAAKLLGVCLESITKLVRDAGLPCRRVGKEYRFLKSEVLSWLAARAEE